MTRKIITSAQNLTSRIDALPQERLGFLLIFLIIFSIATYIATLNFSIAEGFRQERLKKDSSIITQEVQRKEEFFISKLRNFYEANAASFVVANDRNDLTFVSRRENVALNSGNLSGLR